MNGADVFEDEQDQHAFERVKALVTLISLHTSRDEFHKTMALLPYLSQYQRLPNEERRH